MFITQGGLQSTDEAITAGVPLLGVPIMGDQRYNVEKYEHHKIGVKLMFQDVTETNLKNAILELVENQRYILSHSSNVSSSYYFVMSCDLNK